jgi:hypothetical protein
MTTPPDFAAILAGLKDFQLATVDYVFRRLYLDPEPAKRFLIADEVGLGKTMVAKGIVARAVEHQWAKIDRLDILYICANREIANQNIESLNFSGSSEAAFATRITLLPKEIVKLRGKKLNFVSFTPTTSFRMRSGAGTCEERVLIYHLLRQLWAFPENRGTRLVLKDVVGWDRWTGEIDALDPREIDDELAGAYGRALTGHPDLQEQFMTLAEQLNRRGKRLLSPPERQAALPLIGRLRQVLATTCVNALEPDIIILDEFQRFRDLLDGEDEVADLAKTLFNYPDAKVLLLSATPYKMYTLHQEAATDDHYHDFIRTVKFLQNDGGETEQFEADLKGYRRALHQAPDQGVAPLRLARKAVEESLRQLMVRTERLGMTADRDGMVVESRQDMGALHPQDLRAYKLLDDLAQKMKAGDVVEYWKSAPYLLNMMDEGYKLKQQFMELVEGGDAELAQALALFKAQLLSWEAIQQYQAIDPGNAKLRTLLANTVEQGAWQLLWVPPSLPYYQPSAGPYADPKLQGFTKALVFSAWKVVPKVIATLASYEAERRMITAHDPVADYRDDRSRRRQLIRFGQDEGRFTGMSNFTLLYPCWTLARLLDPLLGGADLVRAGEAPTQEAVFAGIKDAVKALLWEVVPADAPNSGPVDCVWSSKCEPVRSRKSEPHGTFHRGEQYPVQAA